uniref:Receptor-like serine/threonine-protein kinase n=1 Tax=Pohlia nutans TaxID=140635 RepID=A0A125SL77_9BRYO|nr:G-type lectin-domain containing receptor kinase 6 [Pohlia nutans]
MHNFKGNTDEACLLRMSLKSCHHWEKYLIILHLYSMACLIPCVTSQLLNTMTPNSIVTPGIDGTLLVSQGGVFQVGFTSRVQAILPSPVYALAIRYDNKVVWVASRSMALPSNNASLSLSALGDLQVLDNSAGSPQLVWSSNTEYKNVVNATIEDTGNLVLLNAANQVVWQSFDSPSDTLLPGQQFSANSSAKTITAWKSNGDWSEGNFSLQWNLQSQLVANWQNPYPWVNAPGSAITYWTLGADSGFPINASLTLDGQFQADRLLRLTLDPDGNFRMYSWSTNWTVEWKALQNECSITGYCGPYSICLSGQCSCPEGFHFVDDADTRLGCQRIERAAFCDSTRPPDTFVNVSDVNWAQNDLNTLYSVNLSYCLQQCLSSCDCEAVIFSPPPASNNGIIPSCWLKRNVLLNGGAALGVLNFLRVAGSGSLQKRSESSKWKVWVVVGVVSGASALAMAALARYFFSREAHSLDSLDKAFQARLQASGGNSQAFSETKIKQATNNYATVIGHGGFGDVFYGKLTDGTEVAAKVLSANSHQSKHEFYNEIELLSKVHHKYLVSLLGYCCTRQHQILVYEFMGGGNLRQRLQRENPFPDPLSWKQRTCIILQVAEGLEYLHHKCSPPIIHRDVKSVNILLTNKLVAKVADFGLSKLKTIGLEDATHITTAVKGTPGYLDPEYHESGMLTEKSDVYAFGVVLLEILTGRHHMWQTGTYIVQGIRDAWRLGQFDDMADPNLREDFDSQELVKLVELGLWCTRKNSSERPSMDEVVRRLHAILLPPSELAMMESYEEDQHHMMSSMELMPLNSDKFSSESSVSYTSSEVPRLQPHGLEI